MDMNVDAEVGALVHQAMFRARVSQTRLAPAMGITQSTLSKKLRGVIPWTVSDLLTVASTLSLTPDELLPAAALTRENASESSRCSRSLAQHRRLRIVRRDETELSRSYPIRTAS